MLRGMQAAGVGVDSRLLGKPSDFSGRKTRGETGTQCSRCTLAQQRHHDFSCYCRCSVKGKSGKGGEGSKGAGKRDNQTSKHVPGAQTRITLLQTVFTLTKRAEHVGKLVIWQVCASECSGEEHVSEPWSGEDEEIDVQPPRPAVLRGAFLLVDEWNLTDKLKKRASVMKSVPHCLKGPFRNALRLALEETSSDDVVRWKLFSLIPRMLLHRPPRGGLIPKEKLRQRFDVCARGEWNSLLEASSKCDEEEGGNVDSSKEMIWKDGLPGPR